LFKDGPHMSASSSDFGQVWLLASQLSTTQATPMDPLYI
jgi:hypothetical protein